MLVEQRRKKSVAGAASRIDDMDGGVFLRNHDSVPISEGI